MDSSNFHRRDTSSSRSSKKVDLNRTRDDTYNAAMARFTSWGPRDFRKQSIPIDDCDITSNYRYDDSIKQVIHQQQNYIPNQSDEQHYYCRSPDQMQKMYNRKPPRHSMPSNIAAQSKRCRSKQIVNPEIIHEEEIREFEQAHCYGNVEPIDSTSISHINSPPMKFYKQNMDPYPDREQGKVNEKAKPSRTKQLPYTNEIAASSSSRESTLRSCPEKPKRVLLKQKDAGQLKKELSNAHFNGAYKNYEIQSSFYNDHSHRPNKTVHKTPNHTDNKNEYRQSSQYQVIVNKHGDVVEYALPMNENDTNRNSESELYDDDGFCVDSRVCEQMINENFGFLNDDKQMVTNRNRLLVTDLDKSNDFDEISSTHVPVTDLDKSMDTEEVVLRHRNKSNVMVTDLDKSVNNLQTIELSKRNSNGILKDLNSLSKWSDNLNTANGRIKNESNYISYGVHNYMMMFTLGDLKIRTCVSGDVKFGYWLGTYRKTNVMLRNYNNEGDEISDEFKLFADSVMQKDFEILKKIRHADIINLMGIACNQSSQIEMLVLQPVDCTLYHYIHQRNVQVSIPNSIQMVQQIANATLYLQECGFIHTNISSYTVMVCNSSTVKLTSFELVTFVTLDIQTEIEAKYKRCSKAFGPSDDDLTNLYPLPSQYTKEQYRSESKKLTEIYPNFITSNCIQQLHPSYLPYSTEYRKQLSSFRHQAPELLPINEQFVFPTKQSDVYALSLLLWEILNQCIPYAIFNDDALRRMFATDSQKMCAHIFDEKRCAHFHQIFKYGLQIDPVNRSMTVHHLIKLLDEIKNEINQNHIDDNNLYEMKQLQPKLTNKPKTNSSVDRSHVYGNSSETVTINGNISSIISPPSDKKISKKKFTKEKIPSKETSANDGKVLSPMNNVTNSTLYRSLLDFNKLLSPRRAANANIYERTSTLKKKKAAQNEKNRNNVISENETKCSVDEFSPKLNENIIKTPDTDTSSIGTDRPAMPRVLDYRDHDELPTVAEVNSLDRKSSNTDKSISSKDEHKQTATQQQSTDESELPKHLIAHNNKIRRNTWLSTDTVNTIQNPTKQSKALVPTKSKNLNKSTKSANDSVNSNKKLNVSIKIIHKRESGDESELNVETNDSNGKLSYERSGTESQNSSIVEESPSVMARVKFFTSLENPETSFFRSGNRPERRSEISFDEAIKTRLRSQRALSPPEKKTAAAAKNQILLKEINEITAEISKCLSNNCFDRFLKTNQSSSDNGNSIIIGQCLPQIRSPKDISIDKGIYKNKDKDTVAALAQQIFGDSINLDETIDEKRKSVRETVQQFEHSLNQKNISQNKSIKKIENKLLNDKINNTEQKIESDDMGEKVEEVMNIVGLSEYDNNAGQPMTDVITTNSITSQNNQTLIKRTFYQESIISGTNVEIAHLEKIFDTNTPLTSPQATTTISTKSSSTTKLTTCVTLNMRQFKRRLSDVSIHDSNLNTKICNSPRMPNVRHSVCGSQIIGLSPKHTSQNLDTTFGRSFEQIVKNNPINDSETSIATNQNVSRIKINSSKQAQSIEDLYIDDDFCQGVNLAANMKLFTNSNDTLDNIDFDLISAHIYEETSESTTTAITNEQQQNLLSIENVTDNFTENSQE